MRATAAAACLLLCLAAAAAREPRGHLGVRIKGHDGHGRAQERRLIPTNKQDLSGPDDASDRPVPAHENQASRIPHILHYIYLSGYQAYLDEAAKGGARMRTELYEGCRRVHAHWEIKFWDQAAADEFVRTHYSWFLPVWESYNMEVKRADALRPLLLHHYGGLYLDLDNECLDPAEKVLGQFDVVLQGSGFEGVNNGMMASVPGHPLWLTLAEVLTERHIPDPETANSHLPIYQTGPSTLKEALQRHLKLDAPASGFLSLEYASEGTVIKIYPLGEFFMPCWEADKVCAAQLDRGLAAGSWDVSRLAGRHRFAGVWNRPELLFPERFAKKVAL